MSRRFIPYWVGLVSFLSGRLEFPSFGDISREVVPGECFGISYIT
jgi:hypothetical protein